MSLHLVDDDGNLEEEKKIVEFLAGCVSKGGVKGATNYEDILHHVGVNYHVVGVFGGQSSGKSTLLNHLFATDFQTLDETVRRGQTTKGAFLSKANTGLEGFAEASGKPKSPLLVVDFEGTDGLERGEDQSFERQLSLFGLSMADTLIINMWSVDVGRYNGANLSLLRTIFEVNLQLFSHESYEKEEKPTLLIILRDFADKDPAPSLATVRKSFDTIWENISRPAAFANATIDALFSLKYYVMPHYKLQRKEFDESVTTLRRWFGDSQCKDFLFRHRAMFRGVPLEGLPQYMTNCWQAIISSKDLDIPTQREMLAQHRCKEVKQQELRNFSAFARQYEDRINRGEMLMRLSEVLDEEMDARLQEYARQTKLYNPEVVETYAKELEKELVDTTMRVVGRFSSAVAAEVLAGLDPRLQSSMDDCITTLLKSAQSLPFSTGGGGSGGYGIDDDGVPAMSFDSPQNRTMDHLTRFYMDNPQCQEIIVKFWKSLRTDLNSLLNEMVVDPPPSHLYGRYATLMGQDRTARGNVINTVTEALFKKVTGRIASMAESAPDTIHRGFEQCLSHNSNGTVKFFATAKGLQQAVPMAQQAGLVFLGCLLYYRLKLAPANPDGDSVITDAAAVKQLPSSRSARRVVRDRKRVSVRQDAYEKQFFLTYTTLDTAPRYPVQVPIAPAPIEGEEVEPGVDAVCVLLTQPQVQRSYDIFRQKCDFTTQIQLRSIEANRQQLPGWVIPALLVLGFNEIKYVVTSPTLLILIVIVGFVFFKNYIMAQWQAFEETGPATIVIPLQTLIRYVQDFYQQTIEPQVQQLQQFQEQQQERVQAQHHARSPHSPGGGFSSPYGTAPHVSGYSGDYPVSGRSDADVSSPYAADAGTVRPRTSSAKAAAAHPVVAKPTSSSSFAQHHADPLQKAVGDAKPRRRTAPKEN